VLLLVMFQLPSVNILSSFLYRHFEAFISSLFSLFFKYYLLLKPHPMTWPGFQLLSQESYLVYCYQQYHKSIQVCPTKEWTPYFQYRRSVILWSIYHKRDLRPQDMQRSKITDGGDDLQLSSREQPTRGKSPDMEVSKGQISLSI
jgi:hypothetical protein